MPQTEGDILQNISVFYAYNDYRVAGKDANMFVNLWGVEASGGRLPLETEITNGDKKVYKLSGTGGIMFPFHGWGGFSLEQYEPNGHIEFDIMGVEGGEDFLIGFRSQTRGVEANNYVNLSDYANVTTEWQRVKIPVKDITADTSQGFSVGNIYIVMMDIQNDITCYLSEMYITSPDMEKQHAVIKVNQIGYEMNNDKFALVSFFPDTLEINNETAFKVINKDSIVKYTGTLRDVTTRKDPTSGEIVYMADFSALNEPGTYTIKLDNKEVAESYAFIIGENIYIDLLTDLTRYFYIQRQGLDLTAEHAGIFARENLHPNDTAVKKWSERTVEDAPTYDISQGWYDAGDFGKYFPPAASTVTDLLFAYEFYPDIFDTLNLNIPESGNDAPDILNEVKWALDMMLKFEDGTSGGFYEVANYHNETTIYIIDTDGITGEGDTKSTVATAWAAAVFAHAYTIYKDIPLYAEYAETCLAAAERAWKYLEANPENRWVHGANRSYRQEDNMLAHTWFMAAASLYRATGNKIYEDYVIEHHNSFNYQREFNHYQVTTTGGIGNGFIHYALTENPDKDVMTVFEARLTRFQNGMMNYYNDKAWPTALVDWGYFWGSNQPIVRIPVELYLCNRVLNRDTSTSVALLRDAAHYILGINPMAFSFISGYGENTVVNIYSGIFSNDGIDPIPPGFMAGGANQYDAGFMSKSPSKAYVDSDREWTTNEHAIYWNAAAVLSIASVIATMDMDGTTKFTYDDPTGMLTDIPLHEMEEAKAAAVAVLDEAEDVEEVDEIEDAETTDEPDMAVTEVETEAVDSSENSNKWVLGVVGAVCLIAACFFALRYIKKQKNTKK
jgi:hypothetical protein